MYKVKVIGETYCSLGFEFKFECIEDVTNFAEMVTEHACEKLTVTITKEDE